MKQTKVDVIIPAYNYGHFLDECLESVTSQVFEDFQVTLIDNASNDDTQQRAEVWAQKDSRIHYVRNEKNLGFHGSVEKALAMTNADLVVILPVDDAWGPLFLQSTVTALMENPEAVMAYTDWKIVTDDLDANYQRVHIPHTQSGLVNDRDLLVMHNWVPLSFGVFRRKEFEQAGAINPLLSSLGDYELWLRMAAIGPFYYCHDVQGFLREHDKNWSKELGEKGQTSFEYIYVGDSIFAGRDRWPLHTRYLAKARQIQYLSGEKLTKVASRMCDSSDPIFSFELHECKAEFLCAAAEAALRNTEIGLKGSVGRYGSFSESIKLLDTVLKSDPEFSLAKELRDEFKSAELNTIYKTWIGLHSLQEIDGEIFAERMMTSWKAQPVFHCVLFLMSGEDTLLADTLDSIAGQMYQQWKITVIAEKPAPDTLWDEMDQLQWVEFKDDQNPYELLNQLVESNSADWVSFIEPGAQFEPQAFLNFGDYINLHDEWDLIYSDEDIIDERGERLEPKFKPDFNLDLLRSSHYIGNACFIKKSALKKVEGFSAYPQAEVQDVVFKIVEQFGESHIGHISEALYHAPASSQRVLDEEILKQVVQHHLDRSAIVAVATSGYLPNTVRVNYLYEEEPLVSIVIPNKDKYEFLERCLSSLFDKTDYAGFEVIVVDNNSSDTDVLSLYETYQSDTDKNIKVVEYSQPFNFSAMCNLGMQESQSEYVVFLNNDTEIVQAAWLKRLMIHAQREDVGAVGPRLVYPETGVLQHAGTVLGMGGIAGHPYAKHFTLTESDVMGRTQCDQNYSALTGSCMLVKRSVFDAAGGMDENEFPVFYGDVDLCLKMQSKGKRMVWTPYSTVVHFEGASQKNSSYQSLAKDEALLKSAFEGMVKKWLPQLVSDPAFNINLSLATADVQPDIYLPRNWDVNFYDRVRVLGLPLAGGSGDYRVIQPFEALSFAGLQQCEHYRYGGEGRKKIHMIEIARMQPDTIVFQAAIDNMQKDLAKDLDTNLPGIFKICSMDDLLTEVPEKSSVYKSQKRHFRDVRSRMREVLSYCDRLVVSTQPLADAYADMINDIKVVPNRLPRELWTHLKSHRGTSDKPRVGWVGAGQHYGDLEIIFDVIKQTAKEVDWVFMGMCPDEIKPFVKEFHDFVSIDIYPESMAKLNLDLAVAPLEIHNFNQAKSNLRLLEYGVMGWPVVCTDIYPYQTNNAPVTRVLNNTESWLEAIHSHLNDPDASTVAGKQLRKWVLQNYILEDHLDDWQESFSREGLIQPLAKVS